MFLNSKKNEKIRYLEKEIQRLKGVIALKDTAINEISLKLEEEIKINVKLSNFRIKILDALGLIGVFKNDDKAIKEVKKIKGERIMKKQTKPLSIRIPLELKEELQKIADKEYRPLATQIVKILSDYVKITSKKE